MKARAHSPCRFSPFTPSRTLWCPLVPVGQTLVRPFLSVPHSFFLFSPSFLLLSVHIRLSLASSTLGKRTVRSVRKERLDQPPGQPRTRPCLLRLTDVHFSQSQEALCRPTAVIGEKASGRSPLMKRVCSGYQSYLVPMFHKLSHELFHWKTGSFSFYFFYCGGWGRGVEPL